MQQSNEKAINSFFADTNVQRLLTSTATWQPLQICYPREVNMSRMLAWLIDPSQGHGLGDMALQSLLIRAWTNSEESDISTTVRHFLAPSNVMTEGFSSFVVTTEVDLDKCSLDVLAVDSSQRRFIAIENKFGAKESAKQLRKYRKGLEKLFPGFLGIYIFLDSNEFQPTDASWISVGYGWLAEFLRDAERRVATAEHVQQTLLQFRSVIEDFAEDATNSSSQGDLITDVAGDHSGVLLHLMKPWSSSAKGSRAKILAELMGNATTLESKAILKLYQLYCRRTNIWDLCIRQAQFAKFVRAIKGQFKDVLIDPRRVTTAFSLEVWNILIEPERRGEHYFAACVIVKQTGATFQVSSFIQLNDVRADKRAALSAIATRLRSESKLNRKIGDIQSTILLHRTRDLTESKAVELAVDQFDRLRSALLDTSK